MHCTQILRLALVASVLLPTRLAIASPFSFVPLGDLPGGDFESTASGVSADGSVVVGASVSGEFGNEAFRWTAASGMVGLGALPGAPFVSSFGQAVSADGSVVIGQSATPRGNDGEAFRWTAATGMVPLGDLAGGQFDSTARGISADGSVIVGSGSTGAGFQNQAVRWVGGGGPSAILPATSYANAISADGQVVVGAQNTVAFHWTEGTGLVSIGDLPGGFVQSEADAVNSNGSVIVGIGSVDGGNEAFRWTSSEGMTALGDLPGGPHFSQALGVSGDGSMVVGHAEDDVFGRAFLWTNALGLLNLQDYLIARGVTGLDGWQLSSANAISADGSTIVGLGTNPSGDQEAFLATVPEPSTWLLSMIVSAGIFLFRIWRRPSVHA